MTDVPAVTEIEVGALAAAPVEAARKPPMPLGLIVFAALAAVAQVLWLGLLGWWLLNLF
jgi:hypothetical protein